MDVIINNLKQELEDKKNKIEQVSKENENIIHLKNMVSVIMNLKY